MQGAGGGMDRVRFHSFLCVWTGFGLKAGTG